MTYNLNSPLGNIPEGWTVEKLSNLTTKIGSGSTPRGGQAAYLPDRLEYAFIRSQNVFDFTFKETEIKYLSEIDARKLKGVHLEKDDVLLNITGDGVTFARCCIVPEEILPAAVNQHVCIIRLDRSRCLPGYLMAYLCLPQLKEYIANFNAGGSRRAITKGHIESFDVLLPPLDVQQVIQSFVLDIVEKTKLIDDLNQTLEQIAQAIFKSWFVDFEPVKAKIAARDALIAKYQTQSGKAPSPQEIVEVEKQAAIAAIAGAGDIIPTAQLQTLADLFPNQLVQSELGEIPKGWEASNIGSHFDVTMGQSPKGDTYNENGEGIVFFQGRSDFGFRFPSPRVYTTDPKRFADAGDTLISVRAPVGDKNMASERCCLGRGVAAISHKLKKVSFTYAFISNIENKLVNSGSDGTVFSSINKTELNSVPFTAPSHELIEQFEKLVSPMDNQVEVNSNQIRGLENLRDTLLPKLLSGEIDLTKKEMINA